MNSINQDLSRMKEITDEKEALHTKIATRFADEIIQLLGNEFMDNFVAGQTTQVGENREESKKIFVGILKDMLGHFYSRVPSHLTLGYFDHDIFLNSILPHFGNEADILEKTNGSRYIHTKVDDIYFQWLQSHRFQNNKWEFAIVRTNNALKRSYPQIESYKQLPDNDEPFDTES